ncbi:MAG: hypothetical protein J7L54_05420 [Elusimicrobia bacterium]|nr:hypothetical protein [Elusimicrobiota bacterium]
MNIVDYYKNGAVRKRIGEYCGGNWQNPSSFTAQYLVGYGLALLRKENREFASGPKDYFEKILADGLDIYRSVWDIESTLGVLDVEYFNLDNPGKIYTQPEEIFELMEPAYKKIIEVFARYKIKPLPIMTGQGYHFSFKISRFSPADKMLEKLGNVSLTLKEKYRTVKGRRKKTVSIRHGKAFDAMGRVLEFVVHTVIKELANENYKLPCVITDVSVGKSSGEREALSFDLSMYGDPIYMRDIRCPFSTHQKHKLQWYKVGEKISRDIPPRIALPRRKMTLKELLEKRKKPEEAQKVAEKTSCKFPDFSKQFPNLIEEYKNSKLYKIHRNFDAVEPEEPRDWARTYDTFNTEILPECVRHCLIFPNDHLLKPTNLQNLTRVLMRIGWHPKHIAGLVTSKFSKPHYNWHENWEKYDPATRANFYVRIFSDLLLNDIDGEMDLNCISTKEKGFCIKEWCGKNLADFKLRKEEK